MSQEEARSENAIFGTGEKLKQSALDIILDATFGARRIEQVSYSLPNDVKLLTD
jgi:hypothetical protein